MNSSNIKRKQSRQMNIMYHFIYLFFSAKINDLCEQKQSQEAWITELIIPSKFLFFN